MEWKAIATDGDFLTTSTAFIPVPGVSLCFAFNEPRSVDFIARLVISSAAPCEMAIIVDGSYKMKVASIPQYLDSSLTTIEIAGSLFLAPGVHILQLAFRIALPGEYGYPEGPREWSPRKKTIPPALLMKNPQMPATLVAIVE